MEAASPGTCRHCGDLGDGLVVYRLEMRFTLRDRHAFNRNQSYKLAQNGGPFADRHAMQFEFEFDIVGKILGRHIDQVATND